MNPSHSKKFTPTHRWIVTSVLLVSLILRWILVFRGGQFYFSDEHRYETSREAASLLMQGQLGEALSQLMASPEHLGFKIVGILPAVLEYIAGESLVIPALFFSLFSVLNLYLIFQISRTAGAPQDESLLVLLIAASSQSLLYYTRHLMPYDTSMSFGLLALYFALTEKPTLKTALACGGLGFLCFITYNGYWALAGFAMLIHALIHNETKIGRLQKAILTVIGFVLPLMLLFMVALLSGKNLFSEYREFATSISQGNYAEGWSLPFEYFWHTEHLLLIILGLLSLYAIIHLFKDQKKYPGLLWAGGIIFIYLCLSVPSVFLHSFVVYGRLARQMMPFLILLAASGLIQIESVSSGYKVIRIIMVVIFIQAAWNFMSSYNVTYPAEFALEAQTQYPDFHFSSKRMAFGAPPVCQNNGYVIENAKYFLTPPEELPQIEGNMLLSALHPVNILAYQYEGYPPEQRQKFRELALRMKFYKIDNEFSSSQMDIKNCIVNEN